MTHEAPNSNPNPKGKPSYAEITSNISPPNQHLHIITIFLNELKLILYPLLVALIYLISAEIPLPIASTP